MICSKRHIAHRELPHMVTHTHYIKISRCGSRFQRESRLKQDNIFIGGVCAEDENFGGDTSDTFDGEVDDSDDLFADEGFGSVVDVSCAGTDLKAECAEVDSQDIAGFLALGWVRIA